VRKGRKVSGLEKGIGEEKVGPMMHINNTKMRGETARTKDGAKREQGREKTPEEFE